MGAMAKPPPEHRLQRVLMVSKMDAVCLVAVAAPAALLSLMFGDQLGAFAGLGIAVAGGIEWNGRRRLMQRDASGIGWLCAAQLGVMSVVLLYATAISWQGDGSRLLAMLPEMTRQQLSDIIPDPTYLPTYLNTLFLNVQRLMAAAVALATLVCQGGLALYYLCSRSAVASVFRQPPL
jgi:hypothetical protein